MAVSIVLVLTSFAVMGLAWVLRRIHPLHITLMSVVMLFDVVFPVWLYLTHDWEKRLIEQEEIFSFLIWTHLFLILTLYALYVLQVQAGKQILAGDIQGRHNHRVQSMGIVIVRVFVFITGALLMAPDVGG